MGVYFSQDTVANVTVTLGNSLDIHLRAGYLSVHAAGGVSDRC